MPVVAACLQLAAFSSYDLRRVRVREIQGRGESNTLVDNLLREGLEAPGRDLGTAIVYSPTRKRAEEEAERLATGGWCAEAYHAGMSGDARDRDRSRERAVLRLRQLFERAGAEIHPQRRAGLDVFVSL